MRGFIIFVLVAGVVFVYLRQKQDETAPATSKPIAATTTQAKPATLAPAPRGQASEFNWMKRSMDRARDVADQSRARTQEGQK